MIRADRKHNRRYPSDAGVSLLEFVVALAIFAAALALVVPAFRGAGRTPPLQPLAMRVAADLRMARSTAMAQNRPVSVAIDAPARSYRIEPGQAAVVLPGAFALSLLTRDATQSDAETAVFIFYPDGSATGGGIALSDQRRSVKVLIDWMTGAVTTEDRSR